MLSMSNLNRLENFDELKKRLSLFSRVGACAAIVKKMVELTAGGIETCMHISPGGMVTVQETICLLKVI